MLFRKFEILKVTQVMGSSDHSLKIEIVKLVFIFF